MRDGYRLALLDLFAKYRYNRTGAAEDITKTDGDVIRRINIVKFLNDDFSDPFRRTHDRGRIDSLVGRDHHKIDHAIFTGKSCQLPSRKYIIFDRFGGVKLHQRHVFVGGSVENNLWPVLFKYLSHSRFVTDIGDERHTRNFAKLCSKLTPDLK